MSNAAQQQKNRQELITRSIDRNVTANLGLSRESGGIQFRSMTDVMEFAKLLAISRQAVPPHCRDQVGICLGIAIQAIEWQMSPYAVASKSYVVNDRIAYESQLIHAVIEQRAPITSRLRHEFMGEGNKRRCRVWATAKGETKPLEYTSPEFGTITPKNSPLWKSKPDLQLYYNASRDWARMFFPEVIMGVYSTDELDGGIVGAKRSADSGIAGLKAHLLPEAEVTSTEPTSAEAYTDPQYVDVGAVQHVPQDEGNQGAAQESASQMTDDEVREFELEQQARGRL